MPDSELVERLSAPAGSRPVAPDQPSMPCSNPVQETREGMGGFLETGQQRPKQAWWRRADGAIAAGANKIGDGHREGMDRERNVPAVRCSLHGNALPIANLPVPGSVNAVNQRGGSGGGYRRRGRRPGHFGARAGDFGAQRGEISRRRRGFVGAREGPDGCGWERRQPIVDGLFLFLCRGRDRFGK